MQNVGDKDEKMVRYLLGELSAEERQDVEEHYFQDDQLFEEFLTVEGELIDGYVQGELPVEVREKFEAQFLSTPAGRRKVELSRALMGAMLEEPVRVRATQAEAETKAEAETRSPWWPSLWQSFRRRNMAWQLSFATVALFFVLGIAWLAVENMRLRSRLRGTEASLQQKEREVQQLQQQEASKQQQEAQLRTDVQQLNEALQQKQNELETAEQLARTLREEQRRQALQTRGQTGTEASTSIATFILPFNLVRGTGQPSSTLTISPGQRAVRFQVDLGRATYPAYRLSLQTVEGAEVWAGVIKKARRSAAGTSISFILPTSIFNRQDYILAVTPSTQAESIAEYSFKVLRKE